MTKILSSKLFLAVFGVVLFGATMVVMVLFQKTVEPAQPPGSAASGTNVVSNGTKTVSKSATDEKHSPSEPAEAHEPPQPTAPSASKTTAFLGAVGEPGSVSFNNPEIKILVDELKQQKAALLAKEGQLNQLSNWIAMEKAHIAEITQMVLQAKSAIMADLTNQMNIRNSTEDARLRDLAKDCTNMPPASAVQLLNGLSVDDIAQILFFMANTNRALILENFATNSVTKETGKATEILERIRKLAEKPKLSSNR